MCLCEHAFPLAGTRRLKNTALETLGAAHGGAVIKSCRVTYLKATVQLIRLASLQCAFTTLDEEIKLTSRRANALEYVDPKDRDDHPCILGEEIEFV